MKEQFGPIIEPSQVEFTFAAPGWTYLIYLMTSLIITGVLIWLYHYHKNKYRREAISTINTLEDIRTINVVLKAVALEKYNRKMVACLYGKDWIEFLNSKVKKPYYDWQQAEQILNNIWSTPTTKANLQKFKSFSIYWINKHDV